MKQLASKHPLFRRYTGIRQAMFNKRSPDYRWCGALGIKCRHIDSFWDFVDMVEADIGPLPSEELKLHRKDLNKDYRPGNLKWATQHEVGEDHRKNIRIRIGKQTKLFKHWCRHYKVSYWRAWRRYCKGYKGRAIFQ